MADVLSDLYILSCVLKKHNDNKAPSSDKLLLKLSMEEGLDRIRENLSLVVNNLPMVSTFRDIFSLPKNIKKDKDYSKLSHKLLSDRKFVDRHTKGIFIYKNDLAMGALYQAYDLLEKMETTYKKIMKLARKKELSQSYGDVMLKEAVEKSILTQKEADEYKDFENKLHKVISVDEFANEELFRKTV
ncbi:acyl-CoA dehydrogenase [Ichthyobacterium seriolicida]|uniref:Acyl-CoA dehydrogenase n=1 Tax=Ichthyobacterium seriolicida TaxID=242600 RepID=A0A1J1EBI6_9FLAO|nr:acyl-CoA dehydrogenase [Ichthyobacterium seriolicida]